MSDTQPPDSTITSLPAVIRLTPDAKPERAFYVARAGLGALPSGLGVIALFMAPQVLSLGFVLWAIWWPYPANARNLLIAEACTVALVGLVCLVGWLLLRRHPGFVMGVLRAPFVRITVTDRRVLWTVPWTTVPLIEIGRWRVIDGLLGAVDRRGRGNAAMVLVPGDPAADIDGNIHFDRLPDAAAFVAALRAR